MPIKIKPPWGDDFDMWFAKFAPKSLIQSTQGDFQRTLDVKKLIEAALSQSTLECPLVWELLPNGEYEAKLPFGGIATTQPSISGEIWFVYMPDHEKWRVTIGTYPTLEAAKSAAQDFVNAKLNGGGE